MNKRLLSLLALLWMVLSVSLARADDYQITIDLFKKAGESGKFFRDAYGYAVFPNVGKGGIAIGGAFGKGRVYEQGKYIGDSTLVQLSFGFQLGGQGYSQIVFFKDQRALREFTSGDFEFGAEASAMAITAGAGVKANTAGASAGASGTKDHAKVVGVYNRGMATFTIAKGGLMYEATINGQKFSYKPR